MLFALAVVFVTVAAFNACTQEKRIEFVSGPVSATGTLIRAENSLVRRGSHLLVVSGEATYFVESRTQSMTDLEGQTVNVLGILEANTSPKDLPVIMATSVRRTHGDEDLHRFEIPALNLRIGLPQTWAGSIKGTAAKFLMAGEEIPILTIRLMSGSTLPPGGTPIYIKNRRGTRLSGLAHASDVYILEKNTIIELHFDPVMQSQLTQQEDGAIAASQFERALLTISFLSDKEPAKHVTSSGAGVLCGGSAGILCGTGYFCNITDTQLQMGECKAR